MEIYSTSQEPYQASVADDNIVVSLNQSAMPDSPDTESLAGGSESSGSADLREPVKSNEDCLVKIMQSADQIKNHNCIKKHDTETVVCDKDNKGTFSCNGCGCMMLDKSGHMWYRCTECDDNDFCRDCFANDKHAHHKEHLHKFFCPSDWTLPHCHSCGNSFALSTYVDVFRCDLCEDYCLCTDCQKSLMHLRHMKHLKRISVMEYWMGVC